MFVDNESAYSSSNLSNLSAKLSELEKTIENVKNAFGSTNAKK